MKFLIGMIFIYIIFLSKSFLVFFSLFFLFFFLFKDNSFFIKFISYYILNWLIYIFFYFIWNFFFFSFQFGEFSNFLKIGNLFNFFCRKEKYDFVMKNDIADCLKSPSKISIEEDMKKISEMDMTKVDLFLKNYRNSCIVLFWGCKNRMDNKILFKDSLVSILIGVFNFYILNHFVFLYNGKFISGDAFLSCFRFYRNFIYNFRKMDLVLICIVFLFHQILLCICPFTIKSLYFNNFDKIVGVILNHLVNSFDNRNWSIFLRDIKSLLKELGLAPKGSFLSLFSLGVFEYIFFSYDRKSRITPLMLLQDYFFSNFISDNNINSDNFFYFFSYDLKYMVLLEENGGFSSGGKIIKFSELVCVEKEYTWGFISFRLADGTLLLEFNITNRKVSFSYINFCSFLFFPIHILRGFINIGYLGIQEKKILKFLPSLEESKNSSKGD